MGFFDWIKRALPNWPHTDDRWYRVPFVVNGVNTLSGKPVDENSALTYSAYWCGIMLISGTIGSLPLHLFKTRKSGGKDQITDDPLDEILHSKPNKEMSAMNFRETSMSHVLSWGNWYSNIVRANNGEILELWPIAPNRVRPKRDGGELFYDVQVGAKIIPLPRSQMLHIPGLGFDGIMGYSVVAFARESIGLGLGTEEFGARYFGQGTHPGVIVSHPKSLNPKAHENLKKSLQDKYGSLGKAHRLMLLDEGMKIEKIGIPPNDSQFLETRQHQITEVARWLNIPPHKLKDLMRATFCLPADVEVTTEFGPKSIANIKAGDRVWSLNGNGLELSTVLRSACTGKDEILLVKTENRILRLNKRHRVLVRKKHPTPRKGIGGYQCIEWKSEYIPAGDLKVGDTLIASETLPIDRNSKTPTREATNEFMEFCGLLLGDGNVINGKNSHYITIARSNKAQYIDYYRQIIPKLFNKGGHVYLNGENHPQAKLTKKDIDVIRQRLKNCYTNTDIARSYGVNICTIQNIIHRKYHSEHPQASLNKIQVREIKELIKRRDNTGQIANDFGLSRSTINMIRRGTLWREKQKTSNIEPVILQEGDRQTRFSSNLAYKELAALGFIGNAHNKSVPYWVFSLDEPFRLAFLRGFLDSDGSVDKKGRISFCSVNKKMLSQIRHLCMGLGIPVTNMRNQKGKTRLPNGENTDFSIFNFICSDPANNQRIGSHDPRYIERLNNGKPFDKKGRKYPQHGGRGFNLKGCSLSRIVSIEKQDPEPVYDLAVDKSHSFIANGVIVHNSNIEEQNIEFVVDTCQPWLIRIEQNLDNQLLTPEQRKKGYFFKHNVEGLLRGSSKTRSEFYYKFWQMGAFTPNKILELENMNPYEGGDKHYVPVNYYAVEDGPPMQQGIKDLRDLLIEHKKDIKNRIINLENKISVREEAFNPFPILIDLKSQAQSLMQGFQHLMTCNALLMQKSYERPQALPTNEVPLLEDPRLIEIKEQNSKILDLVNENSAKLGEIVGKIPEKLAEINPRFEEIKEQNQRMSHIVAKNNEKLAEIKEKIPENTLLQSEKIQNMLIESENQNIKRNKNQVNEITKHVDEHFQKITVGHEARFLDLIQADNRIEKVFGESLIGAGKIISENLLNRFAKLSEPFGLLNNQIVYLEQLLKEIQAKNIENQQFQGENSVKIIDIIEKLIEKRIRETNEQEFTKLKDCTSNLISDEFHKLTITERSRIEEVQKKLQAIHEAEKEKRETFESIYKSKSQELDESIKQILNNHADSQKIINEKLEEVVKRQEELANEKKKEFQIRAIVARDRIGEQFYPLFKDITRQISTKEALAIKKALQKYDIKNFVKFRESRKNFREWIDKFYKDMPEWIKKKMEPTMRAYMEQMQIQVAEEIGAPVGIDPEMDTFIQEYVEGFSRQYVDSSYGQMLELIDSNKPSEEIEKRVDEWSEKRPDKVAKDQKTSAAGAIAYKVITSGGMFAVWTIRGVKTCPACQNLSGKRIRSNEFFVEAGSEFDMGEGNAPMRIRNNTLYPALHQGCDCYLMPE